MKLYLFICLLFLNSVSVLAKKTIWHEGSVVLRNKEVLVGEISIEVEYDLILHRVNGKVEVYPAHKIHSIFFYDEEADINRKFISLKDKGLFNHHQLLEIVLRGVVSIYRKQKVWTGNSPSDADGFNYFIFLNNQLIDLHRFRDQVYPLLIESAGSMLTVFMDQNKLNPNTSSNAITIIDFYNSIKNEDQQLARY